MDKEQLIMMVDELIRLKARAHTICQEVGIYDENGDRILMHCSTFMDYCKAKGLKYTSELLENGDFQIRAVDHVTLETRCSESDLLRYYNGYDGYIGVNND